MILAWKGIDVSGSGDVGFYRGTIQSQAFVTIDIQDEKAAKLAVNRNNLVSSNESTYDLMSYVNDQIEIKVENFLKKHKGSIFYWINFRIFDLTPPSDAKLIWAKYEKDGSKFRTVLSHIKLPVLQELSLSFDGTYSYKGKLIERLPELNIEPLPLKSVKSQMYIRYNWYANDLIPTKLVVLNNNALGYLWSQLIIRREREVCWLLEFPQSWYQVWFVSAEFRDNVGKGLGDSVLLNKSHPLTSFLRLEEWQSINRNENLQVNPIMFRDWILSDKYHAATWLLHTIVCGRNNLWEGLVEKYSDFLKEVWKFLFSAKQINKYQDIFGISHSRNGQTRYTLQTYGIRASDTYGIPIKDFSNVLGDPGTNFIVQKKVEP